MPTKKTKATEENADEQASKPVQKPKRKTVRKVKKTEGPDLSSLPNNAAPVQMDSVAPIAADVLHTKQHKQPVQEVEAEQYEAMRDIKPREHHHHKSDPADFLVPEKFNFDFNKNQKRTPRSKQHWVHKLAYVLIALIILLIGALYYLNSYSTKMLDSENVTTEDNTNTTPTDTATQTYTLSFAGVPADLKPILTNALNSKFGSSWGYGSYAGQIPTAKVDTLFVKESGKQETTNLLAALSDLGIKPEIQQVPDLQSSAVLFLTPTLAKPDLTGMVASVANATGQSGLAKKYCTTLLSYKVTSCQAINATSSQNGNTIAFKSLKALFTLKRTTEFANARYTQADSKQVEDIKLVLGK